MSVSYEGFAYVYDQFMDSIPYTEWSHYISELLCEYQITSGTLVELGCGTGTLCRLMSHSGYTILGIDNSIDMLNIASLKTRDEKNITLINQNMCSLELGSAQYDAFYSVCDSINYLLYEEELLSCFIGVKKHLKKSGIFLFDLKTPYFYEEILGNQTFCDHQPECSYTWENSYFPEDQINQYDLTIFVQQEDTNLFQRFTETHHQRAYSLPVIIDLLQQAGLKYVTAYDAFTHNAPHKKSERIYIIARME